MTGFIHIRGRNFDAACIFDETGTITQAAPIVRWTIGKRVSQVIVECRNRYQYTRIIRDKPPVSNKS